MSAFEKIIGYESIKSELLQVCDMIHNRELYEKMGAKLPRGLMIYGDPGLGKTLMCKAFIEESGLEAFTVRKNKNDYEFIDFITETFEKAKEKAPCIIFFDDMDKLANEDSSRRDTPEYVAVQAGIDSVADSEVFILATVNDVEKLPDSLYRPGRFDRIIEVDAPKAEDAEKIINHYISGKQISPSVNFEDLCKMISYSSCAQLEAIINDAAIFAAYKRKDSIEMEDLVNTVLKMQYNTSDEDYVINNEDEARRIALHEAGHLVACEVLNPDSVGFATIRPERGGFVHMSKDMKMREDGVIVALASKAAVELEYADRSADGCYSDLQKAVGWLHSGIRSNAACGFGFHDTSFTSHASESLREREEIAVQVQLENYMMQAKEIILKNRVFVNMVTEELLKKGTLLYSDIKRIKEEAEAKQAA